MAETVGTVGTVGETSAAVVNGFAVLEKVLALPVSTWRYNWEEPHVRHLGPMAQDWWAAFGLGGSDTAITCADANGVALVSIQALHRRLTELQRQVDSLTRRLEETDPSEGIDPSEGTDVPQGAGPPEATGPPERTTPPAP
ncbi:tail fiber domain-containing protein [Streptomyces sp. CA-181903]|uniref:tail fiber domain-containing protein n=1 Tax=Streptomyces sp. CA-181903 TaxID=3240055 RepID=UPI003D8D53C4